jgi:hypothetical protein
VEEVTVGTVIQYTHRSNEDRHQHWDRLEGADLLAQYGALKGQGWKMFSIKSYQAL